MSSASSSRASSPGAGTTAGGTSGRSAAGTAGGTAGGSTGGTARGPTGGTGGRSAAGRRRPSRSPSPAGSHHSHSSASLGVITAEEVAHVANHNALTARVKDLNVHLDNHDNEVHLFTYPEVQVYQEAVKTLAVDITNQLVSVYRTFENVTDPVTNINLQTTASAKHTTLATSFHTARIRLAEIASKILPDNLGSGLKPPKIGVPKFSGIHNEWTTFKSSFSSLVHNSTKFASNEKFRLLIEALKDGDAKTCVCDLQITDSNYLIGWERLKSRFDSPREQVHSSIRPLLELPALMSQTENGLHKLIGTVRTVKTQLDLIDLKGVSKEDVLFLHFIMARLDQRTIKEFNQSLPNNDVLSLETCIKFLEKQAKNVGLTQEIKTNAASAAQVKKTHSSSNSHGSRSHHKHPSRVMVTTDTDASDGSTDTDASDGSTDSDASDGSTDTEESDGSTDTEASDGSIDTEASDGSIDTEASDGYTSHDSQSSTGSEREKILEKSRTGGQHYKKVSKPSNQHRKMHCAKCNSKDHLIHTCPSFTIMKLFERRVWVKNNRRCFNCLGDHTVQTCRSRYSCTHCHRRHNSLLHIQKEPAVHVISYSHCSDKQDGLLPTALATILTPDGLNQTTALCLLDTGAQNTFITKEFVRRMKLLTHGKTRRFSLAGGNTTTSDAHTTFGLRSRSNTGKIYTVHANIIEEITADLPGSHINTTDWEHLKDLELADPQFHLPGPIDILLGSVIMDILMIGEKIEGRSGTPSAYTTQLGCIIMGNINQKDETAVLSIPIPENTTFNMEQFKHIEEPPSSNHMSELDRFCKKHYVDNTTRLPNGQYQVIWPMIKSLTTAGTSFPDATQRWFSMQQKLLTTLWNSFPPAIKRWLSMEQQLLKIPVQEHDYNSQLEYYMKYGQMQ